MRSSSCVLPKGRAALEMLFGKGAFGILTAFFYARPPQQFCFENSDDCQILFCLYLFAMTHRILRSFAETNVTMMAGAIDLYRSTCYQLSATLRAPKHCHKEALGTKSKKYYESPLPYYISSSSGEFAMATE